MWTFPNNIFRILPLQLEFQHQSIPKFTKKKIKKPSKTPTQKTFKNQTKKEIFPPNNPICQKHSKKFNSNEIEIIETKTF
jgi:hypothetical protein